MSKIRVGCVGLFLISCGGSPPNSGDDSPASGGNSAGGSGAGGDASSVGGGTSGGSSSGGSLSAGGSVTSGGTQGDAGSNGCGGSSGENGGSSSACAGSGGSTPSGGSGGAIGEWVNIEIDQTYSSCGAQSVVVDPVRPSDFYAFVCTEATVAVMKSTDFGQNFTKVNTTSFSGNPWGVAIDPNPCRDPGTPPTLYSPAGFGVAGVWKSTDGGVVWEQIMNGGGVFEPYGAFGSGNSDVYQITVLPDDPPNHVLITFHSWKDGPYGFGESTDGGESWTVHLLPSGAGSGHYFMIVDSQTWLTISIANGSGDAVFKTTTAGRVDGNVSATAWKEVDEVAHTHGSFEYVIADGAIYAPSNAGIRRSTDQGETWESVLDGVGEMSTIVATGEHLYGDAFYTPKLLRATKSDGTDWASYGSGSAPWNPGPAPGGVASSFDGEHWVIVTGNDDAGIWRYVEP
jgi:hypothetical protein